MSFSHGGTSNISSGYHERFYHLQSSEAKSGACGLKCSSPWSSYEGKGFEEEEETATEHLQLRAEPGQQHTFSSHHHGNLFEYLLGKMECTALSGGGHVVTLNIHISNPTISGHHCLECVKSIETHICAKTMCTSPG